MVRLFPERVTNELRPIILISSIFASLTCACNSSATTPENSKESISLNQAREIMLGSRSSGIVLRPAHALTLEMIDQAASKSADSSSHQQFPSDQFNDLQNKMNNNVGMLVAEISAISGYNLRVSSKNLIKTPDFVELHKTECPIGGVKYSGCGKKFAKIKFYIHSPVETAKISKIQKCIIEIAQEDSKILEVKTLYNMDYDIIELHKCVSRSVWVAMGYTGARSPKIFRLLNKYDQEKYPKNDKYYPNYFSISRYAQSFLEVDADFTPGKKL